MPGYVVLIRGINVGGNKKLVMAQFREVLTGLGLTDVATVLNSGNAVCTGAEQPTAELERTIAAAVQAQLGLRASCLVRTATQLRGVLEHNPLLEVATNGSRLMVLFLSARPAPDAAAEHDPVALDPGRVAVGDRVVYQWCPDGVLAAPDVATFLMRHWAVAVTGRNWNTVSKLGALLGG